ncbi:DedA family protein [Planctomycetota bacterium]|nr:DedA family protein [Planctomycetota bacterium]
MEYFSELGYIGLFISAFLAATILPLSSEAVLIALLLAGLPPMPLLVVATVGNVLGSTTNYAIGYWGGNTLTRKLLRVSDHEYDKACTHYNKYGVFSLLFSWLPVVGDPLTIVAGIAQTSIWLFILLVTLGKLGRYLVLTYAVLSTSAS